MVCFPRRGCLRVWLLALAVTSVCPRFCVAQERRLSNQTTRRDGFATPRRWVNPLGWNPNQPFRRRTTALSGLESDYRSLRSSATWGRRYSTRGGRYSTPFGRSAPATRSLLPDYGPAVLPFITSAAGGGRYGSGSRTSGFGVGQVTGIGPLWSDLPMSAGTSLRTSGLGTAWQGLRARDFTGWKPVVPETGAAGLVRSVIQSNSSTLLSPSPQPLERGPTLGRFLESRSIGWRDRARGEAWAFFGAGQFRSAAYSFDSVLTFAPHDASSRLGLVYCEVAMARYRTAIVRLDGYLADGGPSALDRHLVMSGRFGSVEAYEQSRDALRRFAEERGDDDDIAVLLALFLWHGGQENEAVRVAAMIAGRHPDAPQAQWAARMQAAIRD